MYITAPGANLASASPTFSMDARYSSYSNLIYFDPATWMARFTNVGAKTVVATTVSIPGGFTTSVVAEN